MIDIDFRVSPSWRARVDGESLATADEMAISYDVFLGDILFKVNGLDFSGRWDWIPLIDFASSLRRIVDELSADDHAVSIFEFTESDATLRFERDADSVIISAGYAIGSARVALAEFGEAVDGFLRRMIETIAQQYPAEMIDRKSVV